jgi:hypothetical protein
MTKIHRLSDPIGLSTASSYVTEVRSSLQRIEQLLANADGFRQVDARYRLKNLAECADNALSELVRTAVTKVSP